MKKLLLVLTLGMSSLFASSVSGWLTDTNATTHTKEMKAKAYAKCGAGKCGSKETSKNSTSKCGTVSIPTH